MAFITNLKLLVPQPIINAGPTDRRKNFGRFFSKGYTTPITFDQENPWVFTGFMIRAAGPADVMVVGTDGYEFLMPDCVAGRQYFAPGVMIRSVGTTATQVFVYGGA